MIKDKKLRIMALMLTACTLTTAGFTSKEEALPRQEGVTIVSAVSKNVVSDLQKDTFQQAPTNVMSTVVHNVEVEYKEVLVEAAEKEKEIAREKAAEKKRAAVNESQKELLASIIFCEAGNQPYQGQVAVGAVVMNRINSSSFPDSMEEVLYQKGQFGPAATGWLDKVRASGSYTDSAMKAAADALAGANPVGGCLYFDQGGNGMKIGDHYFH